MKSKANVMTLKGDNQALEVADWPKWLLAIILLLAGLVGNHYYSDFSTPVRTLAWLALLACAAFVVSKTAKGRWVVAFLRDSRMEMRKVVWPTREEVMQTTLVVAVMVVILAFLLWGLDGVLVWLMGWLTGQHG